MTDHVPPGYGSRQDADRTTAELHRYRHAHGRVPEPAALAALARCSLDMALDMLAFTRMAELGLDGIASRMVDRARQVRQGGAAKAIAEELELIAGTMADVPAEVADLYHAARSWWPDMLDEIERAMIERIVSGLRLANGADLIVRAINTLLAIWQENRSQRLPGRLH